MVGKDEFAAQVAGVKEALEIGGTFGGFEADEWAFVEQIVMSGKGGVLVELMAKAREAGVVAGIDEERRMSAVR